MSGHLRSTTALLDVVFTCLNLAPRNRHDVLSVQCRHDVFPFGDLLDVRIILRLGLGKHVALDLLKQGRDGTLEFSEGDRVLDTGVTSHA